MSRVAYVDGQYLPPGSAAVHMKDRGYRFGDGVCEVQAVVGGGDADGERHFARLKRSLSWLAVPKIIVCEGYRFPERPFTLEEAKTASEASLTSTTGELLPVIRIDGTRVGAGAPGPLRCRRREHYLAHMAAAA